ncbi:MAG TPA: glucose-1-phosphate adenylyltransferase [Verrucomicrobiae bacterium]|nr:glucose-1-phosphate adenylyltransferase [Verrucomicrobiae bacterium]
MNEPQERLKFSGQQVLSVILGGGRGARLFPLTQDRAKPAVPLGGKYRIVDIPISNCINSGLTRIFLLTQFNSASLHRHISQSYKFDHFSGGYVEILAAEQTPTDDTWYQGTADAVRKNLIHFKNSPFDYMLILSGDQLYRMDYQSVLRHHVRNNADVTVSTLPVPRKDVPGFGIMKVSSDYRITEFVEKPKDPAVQDAYKLPHEWAERLKINPGEERFLASMGIYVFNRKALFELLDEAHHDFGKDVIPRALSTHRVFAYVFQGAWEDIGTIRAFYDCNIDLTSIKPRFDFFDMTAPLFTRPRFLPAAKINGGNIEHSLVSDGCLIEQSTIRETILGLRCVVERGCTIDRSILMGSDFFETEESIAHQKAQGVPRIGIGANTRIETAIVDKNARVGANCVISPAGKHKDVDHPLYFIRDGIVIIPKNAVVPDGTVI